MVWPFENIHEKEMKLSHCSQLQVNHKNKRTDCKALCCSLTCPAFNPGQVTYGQEEDAEPLWLNRFIWLDLRGLSFTNWVLSSTYGKQILQLSSMIMFCNSQLNGPLLNSSVDSITRSKYNSLNTSNFLATLSYKQSEYPANWVSHFSAHNSVNNRWHVTPCDKLLPLQTWKDKLGK